MKSWSMCIESRQIGFDLYRRQLHRKPIIDRERRDDEQEQASLPASIELDLSLQTHFADVILSLFIVTQAVYQQV